ncbi:MAG: serpin family protein [Bacteroidaceae bacterium]|nr:serpin family protein [Bacteroidaceae bacterium]
MYRKTMLAFLSLLLVCAMAVNLSGCATTVQAANLMEGVTPNKVTALNDLSDQNSAITDFAIRLFQASEENCKNTLVSPLSVLCALAMTANGAEEDTLQQMEDVLGMTTEEMNLYLYSYMQDLPQDEKYKLSLANSIWFTDHERFTVNQDFLQTTADYYDADIYKAPFNEQTCEDINNWIKEKTDGMIPSALDEIPADALMYLINALAFDAEWADIYEKHQVRDGEFTKEDGTKQECEFMYSTESNYFEDDKATGFLKYYKSGKYAFVAMLPKEGVSVSEYIASLTGESLNEMLSNPEHITVYTSIPKFETSYSVEMTEILKSMGMSEAFDPNNADFAGLGSSTGGNISISRVIHKTFISVEEKGTKAAAVTIVEPGDGAAMEPEQPKEVYLDRPFVYLLIDCENNIPFFIGTMMDFA